MLGFSGNVINEKQAAKLCAALWYYYTRGVFVLHTLCQSSAEKYASEYWTDCGGKVWCHRGAPIVADERCSLISVSARPDLAMMQEAHTLIALPDSHLASNATYILEE